LAADMTSPSSRASAAAAATSAGPLAMHTAEEAARLLKVKQSWLERQAAARKVPFSMLGGSYRFSDRHLAEIVRLNEVVPAGEAARAPAASRTRHGARAPATHSSAQDAGTSGDRTMERVTSGRRPTAGIPAAVGGRPCPCLQTPVAASRVGQSGRGPPRFPESPLLCPLAEESDDWPATTAPVGARIAGGRSAVALTA
jgi:excisionase family DNA binding protein